MFQQAQIYKEKWLQRLKDVVLIKYLMTYQKIKTFLIFITNTNIRIRSNQTNVTKNKKMN